MDTDIPQPPPPSLWRVPAMWLVIGGPALVVVASFVTLALALHGADPPVRAGAPAASAETHDTGQASAQPCRHTEPLSRRRGRCARACC